MEFWKWIYSGTCSTNGRRCYLIIKASIPAVVWPKMLFVLLTEPTRIINAGRVPICLRTADNEPPERSFPKQDEVLCALVETFHLISGSEFIIFPLILNFSLPVSPCRGCPSEGRPCSRVSPVPLQPSVEEEACVARNGSVPANWSAGSDLR